nr:immunoglobulin heavy chain junction region [Mus musculus]
SSLTSEDSAVY